ncbi:DHA2 family efflux MFS transporter permease subunit, partial [Paenibacillus sepulcri]|nr:DHA2 family efflux MFS transporter permease subunit [Paenibacillus sepulcri]
MHQEEGRQIKTTPIILAIFFGSFVSVLNVSTINIVIPVLQQEFASELSVVQWTLTGFMLAMGTFAPVTGYFGERFSYKRLFLTALIGMTVASILCAISWNAPVLIAFRILQGAFCGVVIPTAMAIIYQIIPREKQPVAISLWAAATSLAPAIGPTFAGWMLQHFTWQWLFWVNVPFGLIAITMVLVFIPYYRLNVPKKLDLIGLITVIISSSTILVALSQGNSWGWGSAKTLLLLGGGLVFLVLFIWRELTAQSPLLQLRVLKNARFTLTSAILCITTISFYSGTLLTPVFLQNVQKVTPLDTGLVLLPASLMMAVITMFTGKLYAKIGPRVLLIVGTVL